MSQPELSVVIAAQGSPEQTGQCIESLLRQQSIGAGSIEIIVEGTFKSVPPTFREKYPSVMLGGTGELVAADEAPTKTKVKTKLDAEPAPDVTPRPDPDSTPSIMLNSVPALHGVGIQKSTGKLVAITEGHCTFPSDWARQAIDSHQKHQQAAVIGGRVLPGSKMSMLNQALFLCDYMQFLPPLRLLETTDLPGNNIVFKRECLPEPATLIRDGFWKTFYCHELKERGQTLFLDPNLLVYYNRKLSAVSIAVRRYHHGRCFGGMRAKTIPSKKKLLISLAGPMLTPILIYKLVKRASSKNGGVQMLTGCMPGICLWSFFWALGEWIGTIAGPSASCSQL